MANIRQWNKKSRASSHYGTIHAFKGIDVGAGRIMIQKGRLYEQGPEKTEIVIGGTLGEKMVDDLWSDHEDSKAISVSEGDKIYLKITFEEVSEDTPSNEFTPIIEAELEQGEPPEPEANEKIYEILEIAKVTNVDGGEKVIEIDQIWRSDIIERGVLGSGSDDGSSSSSDSIIFSSIPVLTNIIATFEERTENGSQVCCLTIDKVIQTLQFGTDHPYSVILVGADTVNVVDACCGGDGSGSSSA